MVVAGSVHGRTSDKAKRRNLTFVLSGREGKVVKDKVDNIYLISADKGQWMTMKDNGSGNRGSGVWKLAL
jgi:hypothetical protein